MCHPAIRFAPGWPGIDARWTSDGWQDLNREKSLTLLYDRAENRNVALTGEVNLPAEEIRIVLAFGRNASEAGHKARATLAENHEDLREKFSFPWREWQDSLTSSTNSNLFRSSTAVLRTHEDKVFRGGTIASLSIPWGASKGDDDLGGYHLVWPRDLAETAGGFLAAGARKEARRILDFLRATQESDGHWPPQRRNHL